ncbi:histidine phosphatase superfamily [Zopfochytrium polystomum]|nr:histidine phosphatase superfamily [Zopfochytrium polystomum]
MSNTPLYPPQAPTPPGAFPDSIVKRVYLIRHGETGANARGVLQGRGIDLPLSERGCHQGVALGEAFANVEVDLIVVSSLTRTRETAEYIHKYHPRAEVLEFKSLDEISWGEWEGSESVPELPILWKKWKTGDYEAKAPQGESVFDVERRAVPEIYKVILNRPEKCIAFVLHGRLLRIVLSSILTYSLDNMDYFPHHNTSVNVLDALILPGEHYRDPAARAVQAAFRATGSALPVDLVGELVEGLPSSAVKDRPACLTFKAVSLDDRRHFPAGLIAEMKATTRW